MVSDIAKRHNAILTEVEVGEANVVSKMYALKAPIGGEGSSAGVIIPPNRCRDGIVTVLYLLKILSQGNDLSALLKKLPTHFNLKQKISIGKKSMRTINSSILKYYEKKKWKISYQKNGAIKIYPDENSFVWFRDSKTEFGILRIISDAPTKEKAQQLLDEAIQLLK